MKKILAGLAGLVALTGLAVAQTPQPAAPKPMSPPPGMSGMGGMSGMYGATPAKPAAATPAAKPAEKAALIDVNSASAAELETLPGIGKARAEAIVKGRPYKGKDELVQKNIVPQNVYDDIKDKIIAKQK